MSSLSNEPVSRKKKILWSVPRSFLPVSDGASKANASLLDSFFSSENTYTRNFEVTLLLFTPEGEEVDPTLIDHYRTTYPIVDIVILKKRVLASGLKRVFQVLMNLFSQEPLTASFFDLATNRKELSVLTKQQFDYILIDGLHTFCALKDKFSGAKFIYRSHNVEYDLWNIDDAPLISRVILSNQSQKMKNLERELIYRSQQVWTISQEDRETYLSDLKLSDDERAKTSYLPMAINFDSCNPPLKDGLYHFLFVGKLDWHPNYEGLLWFLQEVAPHLNSNIQISIVGRGSFPDEKFSHLENVNFLGFVADLDAIYKESDACLIPIFSGSGTRIKVIEALAQGTPILTTSFGIQGSGMNDHHCLIADEAAQWIEYLNHWQRQDSYSRAKQAQIDLAPLYGNAALVAKIKDLN